MKLLRLPEDDYIVWPEEPVPRAPEPSYLEMEELRANCFCAGCGARIGRVGAFWRWPTLGIVTCAWWKCFEEFKNNTPSDLIWRARERVIDRCENIPVSKPGRNAPTIREFLDKVLPVK